MSKDEALKLALEALTNAIAVRNGEGGTKLVSPLEENAIYAIKEVLAQDEQSASQEPVAWCQLSLGGRSIAYFDGKPIIMTGKVGNDCHTTPLYTAPPKRPWGKPWVSLTDEEASWCQAPSTIQTWKRIEAKLKEKNT